MILLTRRKFHRRRENGNLGILYTVPHRNSRSAMVCYVVIELSRLGIESSSAKINNFKK